MRLMTDDCLWSGGSWRRILSYRAENGGMPRWCAVNSGVDRRHIDRRLLRAESRTGQDGENEMKLTPLVWIGGCEERTVAPVKVEKMK